MVSRWPSVRATIVPSAIGAQDLRPVRRETRHDRRRRQVIRVARARPTRAPAADAPRRGSASLLLVLLPWWPTLRMSACSSLALVREQPLLLRSLGVAHEEHAHVAVRERARRRSRDSDRRATPSTPSRARESSSETPSIVELSPGCARTHRTWSSRRRVERLRDTPRPHPGKPASTYIGGCSASKHGRRAADVIGVRMRQHEQVERPAATADVRHDGRRARVAAAPRTAGVEQNPMAVRRAQRDRVALPDVDHVQLDLAVRRDARRAAARRAARRRRRAMVAGRSPLARRAGDDHRERHHAGDRGAAGASARRRSTRPESRRATVATPIETAEQRMRGVGDEVRERLDRREQHADEHHRLRERDERRRREIASAARRGSRVRTPTRRSAPTPIVAIVVPSERQRERSSRERRQAVHADSLARARRRRSSTRRRRR